MNFPSSARGQIVSRIDDDPRTYTQVRSPLDRPPSQMAFLFALLVPDWEDVPGPKLHWKGFV